MAMNKDKCHVMFLSNHISFPKNFVVDDAVVEIGNSVESLGITIDRKLSFDTHINNLCIKARGKLAALKRIRPFVTERKAILANTFIISQFNYCSLL